MRDHESDTDYKKVNSNEFVSKKDPNLKQDPGYDPYRPSSEADSVKNNPKSLPKSETDKSLPGSSTFGSLSEEDRSKKMADNAKDIADYQKEPVSGQSLIKSNPSNEYDPYKEGVYNRSSEVKHNSNIDFVLDKQKSEMPSVYESDGEE